MIIDAQTMRSYVEQFNRDDDETVVQHVSNAAAMEWMQRNVPLFECPDPVIEQTYYFRWWVYRKHLKPTPDGMIVTEFLPDVPWAGKHNAIDCAAGHHLYEGRWLAGREAFLPDYIRFWFGGGGRPRAYSTWLIDAVLRYCDVAGDYGIAIELLPVFVANYQAWEASNRHVSGLFWSNDDRDGMECSISGPGLRPTLNSYLYADARAIARTARLAGQSDLAERFTEKADTLRRLIHERLWDASAGFFKGIPLKSRDEPVATWDWNLIDPAHNVRELVGYVPWYFDLPDATCELAWKQLIDDQGFAAPFGPTTAERRHPRFMFEHKHECLWNGPSWPFATSQTLTAMANLLRSRSQNAVSRADYLSLVHRYAASHYRTRADGKRVCWLDENLDPLTGEWASRRVLESMNWPTEKGGRERGKDYNHSTFCDLVISGLVGVVPGDDDTVRIDPLVPPDAWSYFRLDNLLYRGRRLTVAYDATGTRYSMSPGLHLHANGRPVAHAATLQSLHAELP